MKFTPFLMTLLALAVAASARAEGPPPAPVPAAASTIANQSSLLAATWAGTRAVAVGDHGVVLLSDDRGGHWRQARSVPLSLMLTGVSFADAQHGWAVGHGGCVIATTDGGETWQAQRCAMQEDRPLFAVHFSDRQHGVAVGLWSLVLTTADGGQHWTEQTMEAAPGMKKADLNLLGLFADGHGAIYATAERGQLLRSTDAGQHWQYLPTGARGSLWTGAVLPGGALLVGGQRGALLRSDDGGQHWQNLALDSKSSITAIAVSADQVTVVGLNGLFARSGTGREFTPAPRLDGVSLTAALAVPGAAPLLFTRHGVPLAAP